MSVYGSVTLPVTAYPIGTIVTMMMDDEKGTRLERITDGESCVIYASSWDRRMFLVST